VGASNVDNLRIHFDVIVFQDYTEV